MCTSVQADNPLPRLKAFLVLGQESAFYWIRRLIHLGQYFKLRLQVALQGLYQATIFQNHFCPRTNKRFET